MAYCTREEVFDLGLGAECFLARPRAIESVDPATGVLTLRSNGLASGALFTLFVEGSALPGLSSPRLPPELSASVVYEAVPVSGSSDLFRARPVGGSTIVSFTNAGAGVFSLVIDIGRTIDRIAQNESGNIDEELTNNAPPIKPDERTGLYPEILIGIAARRTAVRAALKIGLANPVYQVSLDKLIAGQAFDDLTLKRWWEGRYINVHPADQTTESENAALAGSSGPATSWRTGTL